MADKTLVDAVKAIVANARAGNLDDAYSGYRKLFSSSKFSKYEPNDQRQALRLMIHAPRDAQRPPRDGAPRGDRAPDGAGGPTWGARGS